MQSKYEHSPEQTIWPWLVSRGRLIGLAGPAGAGKTLAAQTLVAEGYTRLAFAEPIRQLLGQLFEDWGQAAPAIWNHPHKEVVSHRYGLSPRQALRLLGEGMRAIDPEIWVLAWSRQARALVLKGETLLVVDDVRLEPEADLIRDLGGRVLHVRRSGLDYSRDHDTEMGVTFQGRRGDLLVQNEFGREEWVRTWRHYAATGSLPAPGAEPGPWGDVKTWLADLSLDPYEAEAIREELARRRLLEVEQEARRHAESCLADPYELVKQALLDEVARVRAAARLKIEDGSFPWPLGGMGA